MKAHPANAKAASGVWKAGLGLAPVVEEADTPKLRPVSRGEFHADLAERCYPVRHEAFATSLVDGRPRPVRDDHLQASLARGKGGSQPSRPATNNQHVRFRGQCGSRHHWSRIISAQKPGPIANSTP